MLSGLKQKDKIFEVTPICHMYEGLLKDAIAILEKEVPGFGANFAKLNNEYDAWLKKKKKSKAYSRRRLWRLACQIRLPVDAKGTSSPASRVGCCVPILISVHFIWAPCTSAVWRNAGGRSPIRAPSLSSRSAPCRPRFVGSWSTRRAQASPWRTTRGSYPRSCAPYAGANFAKCWTAGSPFSRLQVSSCLVAAFHVPLDGPLLALIQESVLEVEHAEPKAVELAFWQASARFMQGLRHGTARYHDADMSVFERIARRLPTPVSVNFNAAAMVFVHKAKTGAALRELCEWAKRYEAALVRAV